MSEESGGIQKARLGEIKSCLLAGDKAGVVAGVERILSEHGDPQEILSEALIPGMSEVGESLARKEIFIPEVLMAAMAMQGALEIIRPILTGRKVQPKGTIVIGTVKGDIHDIGKNLVSYMVEGAGFQVVDLGVNVSAEKFLEAVVQHRPGIVGMSAMLTTTMEEMRQTIKVMEDRGVRGAVKVMVGGAPVNQRFALDIGADGYAEDASAVVAAVNRLLEAG